MVLAEDIDRKIVAEGNLALARGGLYAMVLAFASCAAIAVMLRLGVLRGLEVALLWTMLCGVVSGAVFVLARRGRVMGATKYVLFGVTVSLPSFMFVAGHFLTPAGAATFITGPPGYVYLFLVALTGLAFDARLSILAGLLAGAEYLACYALAAPKLAAFLHVSDPVMYQELTSAPLYAFKAIIMAFTGLAMAAVAVVSRRLIGQLLHEAEAKKHVSRLFGQYVSPEARERILREKSGTIGERKEVSVLFSDIRSFTRFSEQHDAEAVVVQLNEYFDRMVDAIHRHGGVVDKFVGDAIMAVFGGLVDVENCRDCAVKAGLDMLAELEALNADWQRRGLLAFAIGVGVHHGEVVQGTVGSRERKSFTVMGDTVNAAARIEGLTKEYPHNLLVSAPVFEGLSGELRRRCERLGAVELRGKGQPVELHGVSAYPTS